MKLIYFSFIYSHLQYLGSIWFTACEKNLQPLRVLQNKAIKYIYNLPYLEPTVNLYKPHNLMNIDCIYKYKICCYIYSALNNKKHSNITFRINNTLYNHNTRQVQHIFLVNVTSNYGKKSIHYQGIQIYNS